MIFLVSLIIFIISIILCIKLEEKDEQGKYFVATLVSGSSSIILALITIFELGRYNDMNNEIESDLLTEHSRIKKEIMLKNREDNLIYGLFIREFSDK